MTAGSWTSEAIARLRELWLAGMSTIQIAQQLGVTKNAVIGKAHRCELPGRPTPILPARLDRTVHIGMRSAGRRVIEKRKTSWVVECARGHVAHIDTSAVLRGAVCRKCIDHKGFRQVAEEARVRTNANAIGTQKKAGKMQGNLFAIAGMAAVEVPKPVAVPAAKAPEPQREVVPLTPARTEEVHEALQCRWVDGERRSWVRCCERRVPYASRSGGLSPYCQQHYSRAFKRTASQDEAA